MIEKVYKYVHQNALSVFSENMDFLCNFVKYSEYVYTYNFINYILGNIF